MLSTIALPICPLSCRCSRRTKRCADRRNSRPSNAPKKPDRSEATAASRREPLGRFVGFDIYLDRAHLAVGDRHAAGWCGGVGDFFFAHNLPFYRAMSFTLVFIFTVTPMVIVLGLLIALAVNSIYPLRDRHFSRFFRSSPADRRACPYRMIQPRHSRQSAVRMVRDLTCH